MKTAVFGGTGLIGSALIRLLQEKGHSVVLISRRSQEGNNVPVRVWNPDQPDLDASIISDVDAIVNLAGANISAGRWTQQRKQLIFDSRVETNRKIVTALKKLTTKPRVFLTGSAVGFYGSAGDRVLTENSPPGNDFLANVCVNLEEQAFKAREAGIRTIALRTGVVLSASGGALPKMALPFRFGLGGRLGSGRQWFPWIHIQDMARLIVFAVENETVQGPVNAVAPGIVTNQAFTRALAKALHRPALFPVPETVLKLVLGEMASALLASQRVSAQKIIDLKFNFLFTDPATALQSLLKG